MRCPMQFSISNKTVTTTVMNKDHDEMEAAIQQINGHQSNKNNDYKTKTAAKTGGIQNLQKKENKWGSHLCTG